MIAFIIMNFCTNFCIASQHVRETQFRIQHMLCGGERARNMTKNGCSCAQTATAAATPGLIDNIIIIIRWVRERVCVCKPDATYALSVSVCVCHVLAPQWGAITPFAVVFVVW